MELNYSFTTLIQTLIETRQTVTIGSGDNELTGIVVAYDSEQQVVTYQDKSGSGILHFIPLTSIRSFGLEEAAGGRSCFIDLFKK